MTQQYKELFFKNALIPLAQVSEVLRANAPMAIRGRLGNTLFEPLNLVSTFMLSPASGVNRDALTKLMHERTEILVKILEDVNVSSQTDYQRNTYSLNIHNVAAFLESNTLRIYEALVYTPERRARWLEAYSPNGFFPTVRHNKWRTLARNMSFHVNMANKGLSIAAKAVKTIGSRPGAAEVARHWRNLFGTELEAPKFENRPAAAVVVGPQKAPEVPEVPDVRKKLPYGVEVHSNKDQLLNVSCTYNPQTTIPPMFMNERDELLTFASTLSIVREFNEECEYPNLELSVKKATAWLEAQRNEVHSIVADFQATREEVQLANLRAKLQQVCNPTELELLAKQMTQGNSLLG